MADMRLLPASGLQALAEAMLGGLGSSPSEAAEVADHLVRANLAGHDSHGVGMLPKYVELVGQGLLIPNQTQKVVSDRGAVIVVDVQRGFGQRHVREALDLAIGRARELGAAVLGVREAGHVGRVGTYSEYCAAAGLASVHFVNVTDHPPKVAPFGGADARFITNPFAAALPDEGRASPSLDMATSTIALGKARVARNKEEAVAPGCLIDAQGRPTTDPRPLIDEQLGALTAFGGHKGSGLAVLCELLGAALVGGRTVQPGHDHGGGIINNMLSIVLDPAAFGEPDAIRREAAAFMAYVKASPRAPGVDDVLIPGEPEERSRSVRSREGIPVDATTLAQLEEAAEEAGVASSTVKELLGG